MYKLQHRARSVIEGDRHQNIDALKVLLKSELKYMLNYYMEVDEEPAVIIEPGGDDEYIIKITAKASRLIDVGKRIDG